MYNRNTEAPSPNNCCCGEALSNTKSESVSVALGMQHTMSKRRIGLSSVAWPALLCSIFPQYLTNGKIFGKTLLNI
jgi:hypothetical protein